MKRITLENIEQQYQLSTYTEVYEKIKELLEAEKIKPVKASGTNGKKPALYKQYWIVEVQEDHSRAMEELVYWYVPIISTEYYLHHLSEYKKDRTWLLLLNEYLKKRREELAVPKSMNERSFDIWKREKFLKEEQGRKILKRCAIPMEMLNLYPTSEPLAYYVHSRKTPQNILIIENKDTFYTMRRHLLSGKNTILELSVGTLIYGAGKGILRSFEDYRFAVEPYMQEKENQIFYFGDLDLEGIGIYEELAALFEKECRIQPFKEAYRKMLEKAEAIDSETLPQMKTGQKRNQKCRFWESFDDQEKEKMEELLREGRYIPQEILSAKDF